MRRGLVIAWVLTWGVVAQGLADIQGRFAHPAVSGRSSLFGPAFVGVADDAGALYWNPAGISRLAQRYQASFSHADLFGGIGLKHDLFSLVRSNNLWGIGVGLDRLGTSEVLQADAAGNIGSDLSYTETRALLSVGKSFEALRFNNRFISLRLGSTAYFLNAGGDGISKRDVGVDAGLLGAIRLRRDVALQVGGRLQNALSTVGGAPLHLTLGSALKVERSFKLRQSVLAISYTPQSERLSIGLEGCLCPGSLDIGLGVGFDRFAGEGTSWRVGLHLGFSQRWSHYVLEDRPYLGNTHRFGLEAGWGRYRAPVFVERFTMQRLTPTARADHGQKQAYYTTDELAFKADLPLGVQQGDLMAAAVMMVIYNPAGQEIVRVQADSLELGQSRLVYRVRPVSHWLGLVEYLAPGSYKAAILIESRQKAEVQFSLSYDPMAVEQVEEIYHRLQNQDLQGLKEALFLPRQLDASYPNVYYVAGLLAEIFGDFKDAQACYAEAARLSGGQPLVQAQQQVDIDQIAAAAYLRDLTEIQQDSKGLGIFKALRGR